MRVAGLWALALLLSWSCTTPARAAGWATVVSGLEKVRPGQPARHKADAIRLSVARNECEGAQVLVAPGAREVRVEPALQAAGVTVRVFREAYLPVATASNSEGYTGLWPDALIPEPYAFPADSAAKTPLIAYVEVCADDTAQAQTATGQLLLSAKGRSALSLPLSVTVEPFGLPATSSLPNTFKLSLYAMAHGHRIEPNSVEGRALLDRYAATLLEHRITPFAMTTHPPKAKVVNGKVEVDFRAYDEELSKYFEGKDTPRGARFTTAEIREAPKTFTDAQRTEYYAQYREHFRQKGWAAQLFFYAKDEPKPEDVPLVLQQSKRVRAAKGIPVLVTAPLDPVLTPATDIACPVINCVFARPGVQSCKSVASVSKLREALGPGGKVWWYQSCMSHGCDSGPITDPKIERAFTGWASYMVDVPGTRNRAMGPLAFAEGVEGELYWDTIFAYEQKDPWVDQFAFGGNGDGTLLYPGTPGRLGGKEHLPVTSLRLKHIRDGLEDYEYLKLLESLGGGEQARALARRLARSGHQIEPSPAVWHSVRQELAAAIRERLEYAQKTSVEKEP